MPRRRRLPRLSLRGRLFALLILPLVIVAVAASFARYHAANRLSQELYDNTLLVVALTISRDVVISEGDMLTEQLLEDLTSALGDPVYYRITGPGGSFVTGYSDPPALPDGASLAGGEPFFFDSVSLGRPVRAVALREFISEPQFGGWVVVEVWQNVGQRIALSRELVIQSMLLLGSVLLTAVLILWFGIQLGLKPLLDLREAIGQRSADDLRPIRRWVPPELRPLVQTTNSLFDRLTQAFALRDGFISDAAHQMRNPVAAIQSQAEAAISAPNEQALRARVADLAESARATSRLTSQLLSLERVRGRSLKVLVQQVDLVALVRNRVRAFAEAQLRRGVDVAFSVIGTPRPVECDPVLIEELVANLLDNAAKYALHPGGHLDVSITLDPQSVSLRFRDDGPGVPPDQCERIFDRFHRLDEDQSRGCGLGLAIVTDVAKAHGGTARCYSDGAGLVFEVTFAR
ncbi:two-component system, OmpR family, sensor histidine kinase TctE [Gemmobacter megaterium]|uniref:histidine kinase n=1 Tax=Gemmobacter megaterium TaxID=1086013 RepID=A0A1N7N629_9RHOB|nr:sensor histidine kinase [Gemmobacter megaterium]GGE13255.1 histidine kinase [Gemmobacter megaterium]SIS93790.1 two-component system, OmpR family, sensor histidine kinase TctE [Gemmobacter megaterium]